ncbi:hypothetical protein N0V93_009446 [Gnomoniopsis smithogilvyi]|uniref:SGNH hydrolase-type esterase domain-containing protein n=1 Tax=Gnomoniopsis smithogilvyi TaxID=1191159 RepID=A0A9W9CTT2_9PEZI|nr:hypothetical protein N0V93_009446 [Gnomoniopsis smithogilvyi]
MPIHIVGLGSSFAAGPGIPPQIETAAKRSGSNYAHLLANRLGAKLTDLSAFPAQVAHVPGDADAVLITGGGNDLGYIGDLILDSLSAYLVFRLVWRMYRWFKGGPQDAKKLDMDALAERYGKVLDAIHAKAPKAHVVVVEYLALLGPDAKPGMDVPLNADGLVRHQGVAERLRRATGRAIRGREVWCTRVAVAEPSWEHGIGSKEPWVVGFGFGCLWRREVWYHPNALGMQAVAEMVHQKLVERGVVDSGE